MAYIIKAKEKASPDPVVPLQVRARRAVGNHRSIHEVQLALVALLPDMDASERGEVIVAVISLPLEGGTIPLADGALEVERASWDYLVGPNGWNAHSTEEGVAFDFNRAERRKDGWPI